VTKYTLSRKKVSDLMKRNLPGFRDGFHANKHFRKTGKNKNCVFKKQQEKSGRKK